MATANPTLSPQEAKAKNIVTPVSPAANGVKGYRLEIDEFLADNAMTNLFLQALDAMHQNSLRLAETGENNWWSFYGLAGIHGYPRENWSKDNHNVKGYGYCHHGRNTFPTWHRPYMYGFEQAVYTQMITIANKYTDPAQKKLYTDAAHRFRLPYWDICMPRNKDDSQASAKVKRSKAWRWGFPKIFKVENVFVRTPEKPNELTSLKNPLYQFNFPQAKDYSGTNRSQINWDATGFGWFRRWDAQNGRWINIRKNSQSPHAQYTIRAPTPNNEGKSDYEYLEERIQLQTQELTTQVWQMLNPDERAVFKDGTPDPSVSINEVRPWNAFASHNETDLEWATQSLESFHDNIHGLIGTGTSGFAGHMSNPTVASFDPVFWLHHNNVDRLLAIYQALYPEKYVEPGTTPSNQIIQAQETKAGDPLWPFYKNEKDYYTSDDVKDWTKTGFAVPGEVNLGKDGVPLVMQYLRDTYYWATEGPEPPADLQWPKNLDNVEALTGKPAKTAPVIHMKAISVVQGAPNLVARSLSLAADTKPREQALDAHVGAEAVEAIRSNAPEGSLIDAEKKDIDTKMMTWNATLRIKKFAYNGSFNIHFFIGWVKDDQPEKYMTKMNEVGFSHVFASPPDVGCESCAKQQNNDFIYEDVVPLTNKLIEYLDSNPDAPTLIRDGVKKTIRDLSPEEVVPFLKEHLQWRITDAGSLLLPIQGSGLEVKVVHRLFVPPQGDNLLGTYGPSVIVPEITNGKEGGFTGSA